MFSKFSLVALAGVAQAHMSLYYPPALGAAPSINKQSTSLDKEFNFPLGCCGSDGGPDLNSPGICRGHLDEYDTQTAQVTWQPGQDAYFQLTDFSYDPEAPGGTHSGGSCQVGFSVDRGVTWKVAASYHGACPYETTDGSPETQTFDFKVPTGMPEGDALFGWVWLNREHESFVNCAKIHIGGNGSNTTSASQPYQPSTPSQSATSPEQPAKSGTSPKQPSQSSYSEGPSDGNSASASRTGHYHHHPSTTTAVYGSKSTQSADNDNSDSSDSSSDSESDGSDSQNSGDSHSGSGSDSDNESGSNESSSSSTSYKAHKPVQQGTRRYVVEDVNCDCKRDELTFATRCYCADASSEKRASIERQALRMHRRNMVKRVDACDWATAPSMETSYYTKDAKCAPNAKINFPKSDDFELKWDVSCGVVLGKTDYQLKTMECNMYAAH